MKTDGATHRRRWPIAVVVVLVVSVSAIIWGMQRAEQRRVQRAAAAQRFATVRKDILAILTHKLESLPDDDSIVQRYGKFQRLREPSDVTHPSYAWQLVERYCFSVVLEFENANAGLQLGITYGPAVEITRLTMTPTDEWIQKNPQSFGGFELQTVNGIEKNLCMKLQGDSGFTVGMFDGWGDASAGTLNDRAQFGDTSLPC